MPKLANAFGEKAQQIIDAYRAGKITKREAKQRLHELQVAALDTVIKLAEPQPPARPGGNGGGSEAGNA